MEFSDFLKFLSNLNQPLYIEESKESRSTAQKIQNAIRISNEIKYLFVEKSDQQLIIKIIFEAIYQSAKQSPQFFKSKLFNEMFQLKKLIWLNTDTNHQLFFLLFNKQLIDNLAKEFNAESGKNFYIEIIKECLKKKNEYLKGNPISFYKEYKEPNADPTGCFIPTLNKQGYMTSKLDKYSIDWTNYKKDISNKGDTHFLEIGAAYGLASLKAAENGATVYANDLSLEQLAILTHKASKVDKGKIFPIPGQFPYELDFPKQSFDAILICRVLHFFDGPELVEALLILRNWLKEDGKLFVINETPYLNNWKSFLPEYAKRKKTGVEWPGVIKDTQKYESNRSKSLPPLVHWLDKDTLTYALIKAGFNKDKIEISYIDRTGQFPSDLLMPDERKESVGCCANK